VYIRRERVVELVIERCDGLGRNQAEIRPMVVPPEFLGGASSRTLYLPSLIAFIVVLGLYNLIYYTKVLIY
jgi:hypothetical protein